ncbi:MAG: phospho-N-acetylmuramoyl-pentapeptide-transferase [Patescibacteria group bacterium]|jgi:phospho-N-acetylmuramoyl-pentapeptide-transferase
MTLESFELVRILVLTTVAFILAVALTPFWTHVLYKYKLGKRIRNAGDTPIFSMLHAKKAGTPTMGGVLIWAVVFILAVGLLYFSQAFPDSWIGQFSFLTRAQTLLPLGALMASALVGLLDDYLNVRGLGPKGGGLRMRHRFLIFLAIAVVGALWFTFKLDWDLLHVPFVGDFNIGWWYFPFFVFVVVATAFSVNETDGLDGLAGGTLLTSFSAFAIISFAQGKYDLAVFCGVIIGALLAFLWFNINPARFFMGDTGSMALGVTLALVALLTNSALLLPIIGLVFVIESLSVIIQLFWRKVFQHKLFLSTPIHHHLEANGWPEPKIVMRFWVISIVSSALGISLALLDALAK